MAELPLQAGVKIATDSSRDPEGELQVGLGISSTAFTLSGSGFKRWLVMTCPMNELNFGLV